MSLNSTNKNNDNDDTNYSNSVINMNDDNNNDDAEDMLSVPSTPDHLKHQFLPTPISSFTPHQFNDLALPSPFPDFGIYSPTQGYSNVSMSRYIWIGKLAVWSCAWLYFFIMQIYITGIGMQASWLLTLSFSHHHYQAHHTSYRQRHPQLQATFLTFPQDSPTIVKARIPTSKWLKY